jgi:hypothetical protein
MNMKETVQVMENNYWVTTTTFGDIKINYIYGL